MDSIFVTIRQATGRREILQLPSPRYLVPSWAKKWDLCVLSNFFVIRKTNTTEIGMYESSNHRDTRLFLITKHTTFDIVIAKSFFKTGLSYYPFSVLSSLKCFLFLSFLDTKMHLLKKLPILGKRRP
jgi:hypothetical protein